MAYKLLVPADIISSGEIADAHISVSSVEQHEAALEINEMGISGLLDLGDFLAKSNTDPTDPGHFSRKGYVDAQISAMSSAVSDNLAGAVSALEASANADAQDLADYITSNDAALAADVAELAAYKTSNDSSVASNASAIEALQQDHTTDAQALSDYMTSNDAALAADVANLASLQSSFDSLTAGLDNESLDQIIEVIAAYEAADSDLQAAINSLSTTHSSDLATEAQARIDGDAAVQANLDAVVAGQTAVNTQIGVDVGTNASAISDNASAISAEEAARIAADAALASDYDSKIAAADARAQAAEGVNADAIAAESTARAAAVSAEATSRADGDAAVQANLDSEAATRAAAVESLQADVAADAQALSDYMTSNDAAVAADAQALSNYMTSNDAALASDVAALAQLRTEYDALVSGLDNESLDQIIEVIAAYEAADADLQTAINNLSTSHSSDLAVETQARIDGDAAVQANLDSEAATRAAAVESLQSDVATEAQARIDGDAAEAQSRIDGDAAVQSDLDAWKASHAIGADTQAHSSHLDSMEQGDFSTRQMKVKFETAGVGDGLVMGADSFFVMCEAGSTITLPAGADAGRKVQLKAGVLGGSPVTVIGMIDGQDGMSMELDYSSMSLVYSGSTWLIG